MADVEFHSEINYLGVVVSSSHCITDQHMRKKFHLIIRVTTELLIKAKIALHDDLGCCHNIPVAFLVLEHRLEVYRLQ